MSEKNIKPISNRQFSIFGGIALILITSIMTLNIWVVARVLSFVPMFLFGLCGYLIFAYGFVQGVSLVIRGKFIPIRLNLRFFGIVLTFTSLCLLLTTFIRPDNYDLSSYGEYISQMNYVANPEYLNFFENKIAGGLVGMSLFNMLNSIAEPIPFIIGFLVFFVGLAFIFMNPILALFSITQEKAKKTKKVKKPKEKRLSDGTSEIDLSSRDNTNDIIRGASYLEEEIGDPIPQNPEPINDVPPSPAPINNISAPYQNNDLGFRNSGTFVPAHFVPGVVPGDTPSAVLTPVQPPFAAPKNEQPEAAPQPAVNPNQPVVSEQLTLDFDHPATPINEQVVTAQPTFEQPVSNRADNPELYSRPASVAPSNNPAPAVKKPIKWIPPSSELLETYEISEALEANTETAEQRSQLINQIFADFGIGAEVEGYVIGPAVTRYNIKCKPNVSVKEIEKKTTDLSVRLGGVSVRFEPIVEGSYYSGLEIPNARVTMVSFKDVYDNLPDVKKHPTAIGFGKNIQGDVVSADFASFPHCLVAGTTGSGKSIFIHSVISTLIMRNSPDNLRLVLVDPKRVEMIKYKDIPHLLCPIITEPTKVKPLLDKLVDEMNHRYDKLAEGDGFQDIKEYNEYAEEHGLEKIPVIVAILDEFGDLVQTCKEISQPIILIGQKARACGIHMLIATQSPTSDIITGTIKNNLPTHVALMTANSAQSVTILGQGGAEKLVGRGDMLVQTPLVSRVGLVRLQGCYIAGKEITRVAGYLRENYETRYDEKFMNLDEPATIDGQLAVANGLMGGGNSAGGFDAQEEAKYQDVKQWVMTQQYTSMSKIQRDCSVGFNRAGRFFNRLVAEGIVNPTSEGNKGCRVIVRDPRTEFDSDDIPVSDEQID